MTRGCVAIAAHNGYNVSDNFRYSDRFNPLANPMKTLPSSKDAAPSTVQRSPGRPSLPLDRIVEMALQIVDEEGSEALTMRILADRLKSGTATLYRHFADRGELVSQVIDRVFGEVDIHPEEFAKLRWQDACTRLAHAMFHALRRHGNIAPLLAQFPPIGPNANVIRELALATLIRDGFPIALAARTYATLARYVLGFAIQSHPGLFTEHSDGHDQLSLTFRDLDSSRFPGTVAASAALPIPLEEEFTFGLELIMEGLAQLHASKNSRRVKR
ncbi:Transcriptional regulator, TetR family (modular protein) [Burkholderia cenocepacia]|nr:Transcriptional regulator, TetR family (modular protein) [Burkholderia cenocepacia]